MERTMEEKNYKYVRIDASWYNELIRSKAKYDFFIDSLIASNMKSYDTYTLNEFIDDYYSKVGNPEFV